jgi:hypothetical protein
MKDEERAIPQSREWMFVDLMIEDDDKEGEEELGIENQSESEEDEYLSIESSNEDESLISNMNDNDIKCHHDSLMNNG